MPAGVVSTGPVLGLVAVAVVGSAMTALRPGKPRLLRLAHAAMALVMTVMVVPLGARGPHLSPLVLRLSLAGLVLTAGAVGLRLGRSRTARACLLDLLGMSAVLAGSGWAGASARVVVLLAAGWAVASLWLRWEQSLRQRVPIRTATARLVSWESISAVVAALAMAAMAVTAPMS